MARPAVIADASGLIALQHVEGLSLLERLFGEILIPRVRPLLDALIATGFRLGPRVYANILEKAGEIEPIA